MCQRRWCADRPTVNVMVIAFALIMKQRKPCQASGFVNGPTDGSGSRFVCTRAGVTTSGLLPRDWLQPLSALHLLYLRRDCDLYMMWYIVVIRRVASQPTHNLLLCVRVVMSEFADCGGWMHRFYLNVRLCVYVCLSTVSMQFFAQNCRIRVWVSPASVYSHQLEL